MTELKYLELLARSFRNIPETSTEIINLQAILNLPKGTEHFLSDVHGEYEAFTHVIRNGSGSIRQKIEDVFGENLTEELKSGYDWAYREYYTWKNIFKASNNHELTKHKIKHFFYTSGWKKFEPFWNLIIKNRHLNSMTPVLESILSKVNRQS